MYVFLVFAVLTSQVPRLGGQEVKVETIAEGLSSPLGLAVEPDSGAIAIADTGAGRIVGVVDKKLVELVTGFEFDAQASPDLRMAAGPMGICFLDSETIVVGGGGKPVGMDLIRVYKIPKSGEPPIDASESAGQAFSLPTADGVPGEGNFACLVSSSRGIFASCQGDHSKGWLALATQDPATRSISGFTRAIATHELSEVASPWSVTLSPDGYLAVSQTGEVSKSADSVLAFYNEEGKWLGKYETGIHDMTGLVYGPKHGRLFATGYNWSEPEAKGGLYKLIGTGKNRTDGCRAELIVELEKPTALAFAPNGDLYILLKGPTSKPASGKLVKIAGLDVKLKPRDNN